MALKNSGQSAFSTTPGTSGIDINQEAVIASGINGTGIKIAISDSGIETDHEDLSSNYLSGVSKNFLQASPYTGNPVPDYGTPSKMHGTAVTGIIAAISGNGKGGRGVSPKAKFGGFNYLANGVTQALDQTLLQMQGSFDVFNYSYGGSPDSYKAFSSQVERTAIIDAYKTGVSSGRSGKGSVYVKSAGNEFDMAASDYYGGVWDSIILGNAVFMESNNYPYTILVGAVNADGLKASYSNPGSNIWISAPGGEYGDSNPAIVTTDFSGCTRGSARTSNTLNQFESGSDSLNSSCNYTSAMNGTSSAAPVISGVVGLILDANPNLTWRDVKHILASTAVKVDPTSGTYPHPLGAGYELVGHTYQRRWVKNAADYWFHNYYGFGLVDADASVNLAKNYNVDLGVLKETINPNTGNWLYSSGTINYAIPNNSSTGVQSSISVGHNLVVEGVQIKVTIDHSYIENVGIELTSPSGTKSIITNINSNVLDEDLTDAIFLTNAFYGESSLGNWTIKVIDGADINADGTTGVTGTLNSWSINVLGHVDPNRTDTVAPANVPSITLSATYNSASSTPIITLGNSPAGDLLRYEYCIGTSSGNCSIYSWTSNGSSTSISLTGLALTDGQIYYVNVRTVDTSENVSSVATASWTVTLPGPVSNLAFSPTVTGRYDKTPSISWTASPAAGLLRYEYSIGTSSGATNVLSWTSNNLDTSLSKDGLSLSNGIYYVNVRAVDGTGGISSVVSGSWTVQSPWSSTSTTNAPAERTSHTAVWTGTEMIVWGGVDSSGSGLLATGGRYNPSANSWTASSTTNAPTARYGHAAVWTGSEMIIWGGVGAGGTSLNSGARYNPTTGTWSSMTLAGAPSARKDFSVVWTGTEMVIWGGVDGGTRYNTGAKYDPLTDSWTAITTVGAPVARNKHTAVWTGDEMIIWGGSTGASFPTAGAKYDPDADTWTSISTTSVPAGRWSHTAVWTGTDMIIWGGSDNSGARYNVLSDSWTALPTLNGSPYKDEYDKAVWTGSEMIVWGGVDSGNTLTNTGFRYDPSLNKWYSMPTTGAPVARRRFSAVKTTNSIIFFGGFITNSAPYTPTSTGGVFNFR